MSSNIYINEKNYFENKQLPEVLYALCSNIQSCFSSKELSTKIMSNIADHLQKFGKAGVNLLINEIIRNECLLSNIARNSYLQDNGFYKIVFAHEKCFTLRFHIWMPNNIAQEDIHDHRWYLASTIISGQLHSEIWQDSISHYASLYDEYRYEGKEIDPPFVGKARVERVKTIIHKAGEAYILEPHVLHRIISCDSKMTATLICHSSNSRTYSRNISLNNRISNVVPNYLLPEQLYNVFQEYIKSSGL